MPREIKIILSDRLYEDLKTSLILKAGVGAFYGDLDVFMKRLIDAIDSGKPELALKLYEEKE